MNARALWLENHVHDVTAVTLSEGEIAVAFIAKSGSLTASKIFKIKCTGNPLQVHETILEVIRDGVVDKSKLASVRLVGQDSLIDQITPSVSSVEYPLGIPVRISGAHLNFHFLPKEGRIRIPVEQSGQKKKYKVLVVDDSETIRKLLKMILSSDDGLECVGVVDHPSKVEAAILELKPDVLTLDIHMPEMTGTELVKKLFPKCHLPMVMISSLSKDESSEVFDALDHGAVDYIQKPAASEIREVGALICEKVKMAATLKAKLAAPVLASDAQVKHFAKPIGEIDYHTLIAIGSSTGGTEALREVLIRMPDKIPPIVIVQHIPPVFSKAFADRINLLCKFEVKEAEDQDLVLPDRVLIAPGGRQMSLRYVKDQLRVVLDDAPPMNRHKPSVDYLFQSIAKLKLKRMACGILTGMGADGAEGMLQLRNLGARTLAQDEKTSIVYGMPREAALIGAAEKVVPLEEVAQVLLNFCARSRQS